MNGITLFSLYKKFFKIGSILIGGGYIILPILKEELAKKSKWITENDIIDYFAISQSLPGLIAINIAIFVGHKFRGVPGAIIATVGIVTSPFICIAAISYLLSMIMNLSAVKSIFWGLNFGIIILILSSIKELWPKAIVDKISLILFCLFLIAILYFNCSPSIIIIFSILMGIFIKLCSNKKGAE